MYINQGGSARRINTPVHKLGVTVLSNYMVFDAGVGLNAWLQQRLKAGSLSIDFRSVTDLSGA